MKKITTAVLSLTLLLGISTFSFGQDYYSSEKLYKDMNLKGIINKEAFNNAIEGFNKIENRKKDIITIIDYTKPSNEKRFYVIDLEKEKILFDSYVAHGKNSGDLWTTSFSNKIGSKETSLGFFLTENTYIGRNGYSLRLEGLEKGINDNAFTRTIVVHGATYANKNFIDSTGRLGRSWGCPAIPKKISKKVIDTIKDGSVIFAYGNNTRYALNSKLIDDPSA